GICYIYLKKYTEALKSLNSSLTISKSIDAKNIIANCNNTIADIYNKMGNYQKALQFADSALVYSKHTQSLRMESTSELTLSEIYENMNEGTLALIHYKKSINLRDKIMDTEKVREMTKSIIQNEYEQKIKLQKAVQLQKDYKAKLDSQKKRNLIIALFSTSIIFLLISALIFLYFTRKSIFAQKQTLMLEQKILRTQMNPHFIYNSLAMIHSFILRNKTKEASDYLIKFSKLLRNVLNNSRTDFVSLNTEIKTLTNYLELQKLVLEKGFEFNIVIDENINTDDIQIPPMLAQPFIENALKHGIAKHSQKGLITLSFKMLNKALIFEIMDNGIGYTTSIESKTNNIPEYESLAITITQERLNNTSRKNKIAISITDIVNAQGEISGTKASFEIPFKSSFNNF
ncbi:MAG: histidine kinase, partial [Bacteroidia bacterium]|nr:histidine kinase [Bacteroidia bacterium]